MLSASQSMFDRILLPTDGSAGSEHAIDRGLDLARTFDATVDVLYVVDSRPVEATDVERDDEYQEAGMRAGRVSLDRVADHATRMGIEIRDVVRRGIPHAELIEYATAHDMDCIVMGTHGRSGADLAAMGSTTERVLRETDLPVFTVHLDSGLTADTLTATVPHDDIVVPTDGSDPALRAAEHAIAFAEHYDATIHACYVVDTSIFEYEDAPRSLLGPLREGGRQAVDEIEAMAAESGVEATTSLAEGNPTDELLAYGSRVDAKLFALGRRGRTGLPSVLLGSTTAKIVRQADVPVLSVT